MTETEATSTSQVTEHGRAFLQRRVSLFGLVAGGIGLGFLAVRAVEYLAIPVLGPPWFLHPSFTMHGVGAGTLLALGVLLRRGTRSVRFIHTAEAIGLLVSCAAYEVMGVFIPDAVRPDTILLMALNVALMARALYVPSTAKRTLVLTVLVGLTLVPVTYWMYRDTDPAMWREFFGDQSITATRVAATAAWGSFQWWVPTVILTTLASHVIYGLRREARKARQLGQYTLVEKLGEGGMGRVYRAKHAMLRRPAAVKLLLPEKMSEGALVRFEKEVQLTAALSHPNTVTIFDYGRTPDGVFYYAMELLDGPTLQEVVALDGAQPPGRVVHVLAQAAGALAEAHAVGLIHRDIKPANVMLVCPGGVPDVVKVVDFGLVKELGPDHTASLTNADVITGTPQYMSPEAITAPMTLDARADIYALGAVGYFLLTGEHLFTGSTAVEICSHHLHTTPVPPSERIGDASRVPEALEALILGCLEKKRDDRPASAAAVRAALLGLEGVETWGERESARWWRDRGPDVRRARASRPSSDGPRTFSIDLVHRRDAGP
jgi:serine/threonine-protein kinase